jgi:hypothetical protein
LVWPKAWSLTHDPDDVLPVESEDLGGCRAYAVLEGAVADHADPAGTERLNQLLFIASDFDFFWDPAKGVRDLRFKVVPSIKDSGTNPGGWGCFRANTSDLDATVDLQAWDGASQFHPFDGGTLWIQWQRTIQKPSEE